MDLSTTYLGLKLANPLMPGASPLTHPTAIRQLVEQGASAVVLHSMDETQITREQTNTPDEYLAHIAELKRTLAVPLIAATNSTAKGSCAEHAAAIEDSGADALELNLHSRPTDPQKSANEVESRMVDIVASVCSRLKIPVAVKLSPFYTSLPSLARQLEAAGAAGIVLFNRYCQPDFEVSPSAATGPNSSDSSDPSELRLRLKWLAVLSPQTRMSLALTGSVCTGLDAIKGIIAGAHAVQAMSSSLTTSPQYMQTILQDLTAHMKRAGADSIKQLRGCMNHDRSEDPSVSERSGYLSLLHSRPITHPT